MRTWVKRTQIMVSDHAALEEEESSRSRTTSACSICSRRSATQRALSSSADASRCYGAKRLDGSWATHADLGYCRPRARPFCTTLFKQNFAPVTEPAHSTADPARRKLMREPGVASSSRARTLLAIEGGRRSSGLEVTQPILTQRRPGARPPDRRGEGTPLRPSRSTSPSRSKNGPGRHGEAVDVVCAEAARGRTLRRLTNISLVCPTSATGPGPNSDPVTARDSSAVHHHLIRQGLLVTLVGRQSPAGRRTRSISSARLRAKAA